MKKVRIYSLRKDLGLDNCTPILDACKQVGINVNSASSTITKSQARQVAELLTNRPASGQQASKSTRPSKRNSKGTVPHISSASSVTSPDSSGARDTSTKSPAAAKKSRQQPRSQSSAKTHVKPPAAKTTLSPSAVARKTSSPQAIASTARQVSPQYLNGNRVFTLKVTGLKGARIRHALTTYTVSFDRLGQEIQRINRSEAKIVDIAVSP